MKTNTKPLKRTPLKRKTALKASGKTNRRTTSRKSTQKGYKPPAWFNAVKPGSHGSTPAQKRLWRVVSETYRQEDWEIYSGTCPCCGAHLDSWKDAQLAHWLRWSLCNSWMKVERKNLVATCAGCNLKDDAITLWKMGEVLKARWGEDILLWIEMENQRIEYRGQKMEPWMCVDYVARLRPDLVDNEAE